MRSSEERWESSNERVGKRLSLESSDEKIR